MMKKLMAMVVTGIMLCMPMTVGATSNVQADLVMMNQLVHAVPIENPDTGNADYEGEMGARGWGVNGVDYNTEGVFVSPYVCGEWTDADVEASKGMIVSDMGEGSYTTYYDEFGEEVGDISSACYAISNRHVYGIGINGEYVQFDFDRTNYYRNTDDHKAGDVVYDYYVNRPILWYDLDYNPIARPY